MGSNDEMFIKNRNLALRRLELTCWLETVANLSSSMSRSFWWFFHWPMSFSPRNTTEMPLPRPRPCTRVG